METNLYCCTRTGRTISEKTMDDGNVASTKEDKIASGSLASLYGDRPVKLTANGHDFAGEPSSPREGARAPRRASSDALDDRARKRINPLRIHLGKRPFVDNSNPYQSAGRKKKQFVNRPSESSASKVTAPRVPKLIPKRADHKQFHNATLHTDNEQDKPVPRLVPKSRLQQIKKGKAEKPKPHLKDYAESLGLQPMVKFKCRKCCSMSFQTLPMLKEHQLECRAQAKEPALSPEAAPSSDSGSGPSRVTRKVYLCSACGTYYENWNLFLHMREVHNRHICLFCLGMFSKAEKLSSHLTNKHNVQEFNYSSKEEFCKVYNGTLYLMCCSCDEICSEQDDFFNHDCNNVKPKPVPMLVSKNTAKLNNAKRVRKTDSTLEQTLNGSTTTMKEPRTEYAQNLPKTVSEKKETCDLKLETLISQVHKPIKNITNFEPISDICMNSPVSSNSLQNKTTSMCSSSPNLDHLHQRLNHSPGQQGNHNSGLYTPSLPNGEENMDISEESDSLEPDVPSPLPDSLSIKSEEPAIQPVEKEGGIKLKLSLNNANSPVIINSTVDPTVGQQYANKPPSRTRRPPKRYEKPIPESVPVKPPSIKITICDKADSPFVKTTIVENNKETTLKTLMNNNPESDTKPAEIKPENTIKTTIYDNKLEEINTLNRVPKLTVRVPKEFLDKDSSSDYSSDSDACEKLTVDDLKPDTTIDETSSIKEETILEQLPQPSLPCEVNSEGKEEEINREPEPKLEPLLNEQLLQHEEKIDPMPELKSEPPEHDSSELNVEDPNITEDSDIPVTELTLDRPIDKYPLKDLLKVFLGATIFNCIYCNHARKIAVNCEQLALHMVSQHRFSATVNSITAEELMPETITAKVKAGAVDLCTIFINLDTYDSVDKCEDVQYSHNFECFQCYFKTAVHKDLYLHNRKMHQKAILLCVMCKNNFYSYSELLCHLCPGTYDSDYETKFRCCFCNLDTISSSFRLMVHLRKIHHTCDVCLEFCQSQARLSNHVWKHKLHHLCYRCGIAYRNKVDITNHLFWKHGTESVLCKRCLQKKWPHVYHFCTPPATFNCDECNLQFTRAVYMKVHKRLHSEEYPYLCSEEGCTEKYISKKLLNKHIEEHKRKLLLEDLKEESSTVPNGNVSEESKEPIPVINLVDDKPLEEAGSSEVINDADTEPPSKKLKKKKLKDKDALLLDMNLPALNLSESDSSDESDSGAPNPINNIQEKASEENTEVSMDTENDKKECSVSKPDLSDIKLDDEKIAIPEDEKPDEQQVLDIWDNFKKYQAKVEKQKEKTPPLVPIRKHVCESDHDYCVIPIDLNGDEDMFSLDKKKSKKSPKKRHGDLSSSSSSSSDSDSSCSCGSNCSCSSSSGSSSSSSSDSDSSDESSMEKKKSKQKKSLPKRRISNGSNVDVMGMSETPVLVPEKPEPLIAETDLDTTESETDEEFYDKNPQSIANKLLNEKKNLLASVAPSDGGSVSEEISRSTTPVKDIKEIEPKEELKEPKEEEAETKEKTSGGGGSSSTKKKSKKKKKSKSSKKHGPIKINIPKDVIAKSEVEMASPLAPNKITISLQSNTVQIPEIPKPEVATTIFSTPVTSAESKRASKRRRVPNRFYGYSSDEETPPNTTTAALKPQLPPKLEWRKEDLPSPVTHKPKKEKEVPSTIIPQRLFNYKEPIRLTTPIPDPEPPRILMNTESMESSDSDSSGEGALEIYQPNSVQSSQPLPPPTYLNSGTSSLPYAFQRPAARQAREGESVYCYCRCPYDEVSEMIACDAEGCPIEWFHFECVGIMVPPKGKWYCPECRKNQTFSGYR